MESQTGTVLSTLLKKRLKTLGYPSLRRFHADRPGLGLSYEVLRQVVYGGHIPRPETLFRILGSMQFSSSQVRKICGMHYGDYLPLPSGNPGTRQRGFLGDGRGAGADRGAEGPPERRPPGGAAAAFHRGARGDLPVPRPEEPDPPVPLPWRKPHVRFRGRDRLPGPLPRRPAGLSGRRSPRRRHTGADPEGRPGTVRG